MPALSIELGWHGGAIDAVALRADLPQAARVLEGRTPDEALALLGRLYSVCGQAQRAAAELALAAATGTPLPAARHGTLEAAVARECASEHLWRLLVDWPRKLGIGGVPDRFAYWYRRIGAADGDWAAELGRELAGEWLGVSEPQLETWSSVADYEQWARTGATPLATLFAALQAAESAATGGRVQAAAASRAGAVLVAPETGAFVQHGEHPWLASLQAAGRGLEARVAARVVALTRLAAALAAPGACDTELELDAESPALRCGRAVVTTARGVLVHDAAVADGRIARYGIRTPTECNFADGGAYRALLLGQPAADAAAAARLADLWALALDPCVPYSVRAAETVSGGSVGHA